jgi:hypothetical protein
MDILRRILSRIEHPGGREHRQTLRDGTGLAASSPWGIDHLLVDSEFETDSQRRQHELDTLLADGFSPENAARMVAGEPPTEDEPLSADPEAPTP